MTYEEKELLLKDICARLPYGVKGLALGSKEDTISSLRLGEYPCVKTTSGLSCHLGTGQFKPYLRPMSSMTKEEINEFHKLRFRHLNYGSKPLQCVLSIDEIDWLNAHHFDYRGLISKGLALEAPEGMYKKDDNESINKTS